MSAHTTTIKVSSGTHAQSNTCTCVLFSRETVESNGTFENTLSITPMLTENKEKRGLSLDGRLKDEDTNLASTTM